MTAMAAGAYVAYRNRSPSSAVSRHDSTEVHPLPASDEDQSTAETVSTGTADKVVAAMDATHVVSVPGGSVSGRVGTDASSPGKGNGSAVAVAEPAGDPSDDPTQGTRALGGHVTNPPVELPKQSRPSGATLIGLATAAGVGALALGGWAFVAGLGSNDTASSPAGSETVETVPAPEAYQDAVALLANPAAERIPLRGSVRRIVLVVEPSGTAALVLNGLGPAPEGRAYQAWVMRADGRPFRSAALFTGSEVAVPLALPVLPGATVAVTLERAQGASAPTRTPKLFVTRPS